MQTERKRQINLDVVIKVQAFLQEVKKLILEGKTFSINNVATSFHIDRQMGTMSISKGFFKRGVTKGEYHLGEEFGETRTDAKKLIEHVRIQRVQRLDLKIASGQTSAGMSSESYSKQNSNPEPMPQPDQIKQSMLNRALKQSSANPLGALFSEKEKEFDDKLKIACAITSGCYVVDLENIPDFEKLNSFIVASTNDLYSKLLENK